jgi:hypothetical protein
MPFAITVTFYGGDCDDRIIHRGNGPATISVMQVTM